MSKKILIALFAITAGLLSFSQVAFADVAIPTTTTVYFEIEGSPVDEPIDYSVTCYGYFWAGGWMDSSPREGYDPENPDEVFAYDAHCESYGCEIEEDYYLNLRSISYCDLFGESETQFFYINNYASTPLPANCTEEDAWAGRTCEQTFDLLSGVLYNKTEDNLNAISACEELSGQYYFEKVDAEEEEFQVFCNLGAAGICTQSDLLQGTCEEDSAFFSDVPDTHENYDAIRHIKELGIVEGYGDGTYQPKLKINRSEFTKIILLTRFSQDEVDACEPVKSYSDVEEGIWYHDFVCLATNENIVKGYSDGTFKPYDTINFAEAAKIIVRTILNKEYEEGEPWFRDYVIELQNEFAIPESINAVDKHITRGEMAEMVYRLMEEITDKASRVLIKN